MAKHIGIVGCSAEGASLCYRTICAEAAERMGPHAHPELSMHTPSLAKYVDALNHGDLDTVANLMLAPANILANAGVDFLICPDNTIHQAFDRVASRSPKQWLHIAEVTAAKAQHDNLKTLGVLGTASLVRSNLYPRVLAKYGIQATRPADATIEEVDRIIFEELVPGRIVPASRKRLSTIIEELQNQGCDGVILGCTEIPLIIGQEDSVLPILDTTRLLARAALDHALNT